MSSLNHARNDAAVSSGVSALRADYSGLTTTSSFALTGGNGGGTASATAGSELGEVDTTNIVDHYIPAKGGYKIVLWRVCGALSATGAAATTFTALSPKGNGTTFYEVGRIAATFSTAAAFELPLVASVQPAHDRQPLAVGFVGRTLRVRLSGTSISAVPVTLFYSYVKETDEVAV